jgi:ribosome-binding protein aMBF1 (putative translation factor)
MKRKIYPNGLCEICGTLGDIVIVEVWGQEWEVCLECEAKDIREAGKGKKEL